jgi:D-methionine transport system ATP-binding protein
VPPQLVPSLPDGTIVELRYKGEDALEPLISAVARRYDVAINVLHANVEYFGAQAIGVLLVLVSGPDDALRSALETLRSRVFGFRELDRESIGRVDAGDSASLSASENDEEGESRA